MSFQPSKDSSGRILKKDVVEGTVLGNLTTGYSISDGSSLFNTNNYQAVIPSISGVTLSSDDLNYLNVTDGTASANKALVLDSSSNISGINIVKCNSITANGVVIDPNVSTDNIVPANDYYGSITPGTAQEGKAIVLNSSGNYSGVKKINGTVNSTEELVSFSKDRSFAFQFSDVSNLSSTDWYDCVYSVDLNKYLCVGHNKTALSINGTSWDEKTQAISFRSVIWVSHKGKFYAVASDGVYSSQDGSNWDLQLSNSSINGIAAGLNIILAVGVTTYYSAYDSTWTSLATATDNYRSVAFDNVSNFVIVTTNVIRVVSDLTTPVLTSYYSAVSNPLTGTWESVAYGNGQFIAVSSATNALNKFASSKDGINWSAATTFLTSETELVSGWRIKFLDNYFYCLPIIPSGQEAHIYYTKDASDWSRFKHNMSNHIASMAWNSVDDKLMLLTRGTQMQGTMAQHLQLRQCNTQYSKPTASELSGFNKIVSISQTGIMFACGTDTLYYSTDGKSFNQCYLAYNGGNIFDQVSRTISGVAYSPTLQLYVAASAYSAGVFTQFMKSTDGITWTECGTVAGSATNILWSTLHSKFIGTYTNNIVYSSDAITWQSIYLLTIRSLFVMIDSDIGVVSASGINKIDTSMNIQNITSNGSSYTNITLIGSTYYTQVSNNISSSSDLINWTVFQSLSAVSTVPVYHEDLGAIVVFASDNTVRVYKGGSSFSFALSAVQSHSSNSIYPCYNSLYKCIYTPCTLNGYSIAKTISTAAQTALTYSSKIYRTLPSAAGQLQNLEDAIYTGFLRNTRLTSSGSGVSEVSNIFFSNVINAFNGIKTSPTTTNLPITGNTSFATYSNYVPISNYFGINAVNVSPTNTLWLVIDTAQTNVYLAYVSASTATVSGSIASLTWFTNRSVRFKKVYNKDFVYFEYFTTLGYIGVYPTNANSFARAFTILCINSKDYVINGLMDTCLVLTTANKIIKYKLSKTYEFSSDMTLPSETYHQLDFFGEADIYLLTSAGNVRWSQNGTTWTTISALTGYSFSAYSMKHIPELQIMTIVSTNLFAYTRDGKNWTLVTVGNKLWTSCAYNPLYANFLLHCKADGTVFVASPILATLHNLSAPTNFYVSGKSLNAWQSNNSPVYNVDENTYGIDMRAINMTLGVKNTSIVKSSDVLLFSSGAPIQFKSLDNAETSPFRINGKNVKINQTALKSLPSCDIKSKSIQKNKLLMANNGNLQVNALTCTSLTLGTLPSSNITGPVVTDSSKNAFISNLTTEELNINGASLKWQNPSLINSRTFTADDYMCLKKTNFNLGVNANYVLGSAYSPELNTIVVWACANNTLPPEYFYVSKDKGVTWTRALFTIISAFVSGISQSVRKIIWCTANQMFVAVGTTQIHYSPDGYNWTSISPGVTMNRAHITYDSKQNRLLICSAAKLLWTPNILDLNTWTAATTATDIMLVEYFPALDRYLHVFTSTSSTIQQTTDIYATTITSTLLSSAVGTVYSIVVVGSYFYYSAGSVICRKNDLTASAGTTVFTNAQSSSRGLCVVPEINLIINFTQFGWAYSTNGTTWAHIPHSHALINNPFSNNEGVTNYAWFAEDRLMISMNNNGEVLESDLFNTRPSTTFEYLSNVIENRSSTDVLINGRKENNSLYMKHSSTNRDLYATAFGGGNFVTVGTNVFMYESNLKKTQIFVTHTGAWQDIVYTDQFVKVGTDVISYSTSLPTWTDVAVAGNWFRIVYFNSVYVIASPTAVMYSSDLESWTDITPSSTTVNGIEVANGLLFLMSNDKILYTADVTQNWTTQNLVGKWYGIGYGKGIYVIAGDGMIARGRTMTSFRRSFVPRRYHRVVYVRLFSDFFIMSKDTFYDCQSAYQYAGQGNVIIRTTDGVDFSNSLRIGQSSAQQTLNISNLYYFENTDQFFMPLNNSPNKLYIVSHHTVANKSLTKITTPSCFATNRVYSGSYAIDIARNSDMTTSSPASFNVFQDSAAKPSTSTWLTTSDERLKEDIVPANISTCYDNVSNLSLKYYKWKDQYISEDKSKDRHKLGWIAQEVEQSIPKAVGEVDMFGLQNCKTLDTDQIVANMYGAIQMLIKKIEEKEQAVADAGLAN